MATAATSQPSDFVQSIQNSDALQLIGVIANCSGILSSALAVVSFVQGLTEPDNSQLLSAIEQLQQTLNADFTALGNLIQQQTQIIVDTVNRDGMALALANSDVAMAQIQDFLSHNNNEALDTAEADSVAGLAFFTELDLTTPSDLLFFLPGLIKAGTVRAFVIASEPLKDREPSDVVVENITSMVTLLSAMIDSVVSTVTTAHTVDVKSHTIRCAPLQQVVESNTPDFDTPFRTVTVIDGYNHEERSVVLQFFDAQRNNPPCEQPSGFEKAALAAAEQVRAQGITDELAFIGIPQFKQILQSWQNLITVPIKTVFDLNGTWKEKDVRLPLPVFVSVDINSITVDLSAFRRPPASGTVLSSTQISVSFDGDSDPTIGTLVPPNTIDWSSQTTWIKE